MSSQGQAEIFDLGYQGYQGERTSGWARRRAVWRDGVRVSLGLGRGTGAKIAPWLLRFIAASRPERVEEISIALRSILLRATAVHRDLARAIGSATRIRSSRRRRSASCCWLWSCSCRRSRDMAST